MAVGFAGASATGVGGMAGGPAEDWLRLHASEESAAVRMALETMRTNMPIDSTTFFHRVAACARDVFDIWRVTTYRATT
jgi:hypothetical protein